LKGEHWRQFPKEEVVPVKLEFVPVSIDELDAVMSVEGGQELLVLGLLLRLLLALLELGRLRVVLGSLNSSLYFAS
jgi:hypothetical protein